MSSRHHRRGLKRGGVVYILALTLLITLTTLAAAFCASASLELRKSQNVVDTLQARLSAESGLSYMLLKLDEVRMPVSTNSDTLMTNLAMELVNVLGSTADVDAAQIQCTSTLVSVPEITVENIAFSTSFAMESDGAGGQRCRMTVTGRCGAARRQASIAMTPTPRPVEAFDYGIASKGRIYISGSGEVNGVNTGQEATVFSMSAEPVAIEAGGSATIGGDLFVTNASEESILLGGGGLSVAGETDIFEIINNHAHFDVEPPEFPEIDITPFAALTTGVIDSNTDLPNQDLVLNNIRIKAGTNPKFTSDTVINGVLVIESPNEVVFTAGTVINGIIVTEDDVSHDIVHKQIEFRGHVSAPGVGALPDTEEFAAVKQLGGTTILAPGFAVTFRGTTNTINGTIAADQFAFRGNTDIDGELTGSIIGLKDREMILQGNATIRINRQTDDDTPAGFVHPIGLIVAPGTYTE